MKVQSWCACALFALGVACWGCAGGMDRAATSDAAVFSTQYDPGYIKRVGLGVVYSPSTELGHESARFVAQAIAAVLKAGVPRLNLGTAWETGSVKTAIDLLKSDDIDLAAAGWRKAGFQDIATVALLDLRLVAEKTGALWFRKQRHFIRYSMVFDLYDTLTGTKLVSEVSENSLKISKNDYEALQSGTVLHIEDLDDSLADLADDFGEQAAEALKNQPWQTSIISVEEKRIVFAGGRASGIQVGDRLAVYRGNRHVTGPKGTFMLPGMKVVDVDVEQVDEQRSYAVAPQDGAPQAGDIAMPIGRNPSP